MTWLGLLKAMVIAAAALAEWLGRRQLMHAVQSQTVAQQLRAVLDDIGKANAARVAVRSGLERDPGRLRDDDGFKRD